jgi:hypothetical protein
MNIQLTTAQALRTFAGAALCGLGMDLVDAASCRLTDVVWQALQETVSVVSWGVLTQAGNAEVLGRHVYLLGCPIEMLNSVASLVHLLSRAL